MKINVITERKAIYSNVADVLGKYKKTFFALTVIQFLFLFGTLLGPYLYGVLIDDVMINKKIELLIWVCLGYVGIYCFDTILMALQRKTQVKTYNELKLNMRKKVWGQYMKAPFTFHEKYGNGDLKQRMDSDINAFENFMNEQIITYIFNVFATIFYLCIIIAISWKLATFSMLMVPVAFWMTKQMAKGSGAAWRNYREDFGKYESWLQGSLQNWKEIKVLNVEDNQTSKFDTHWNRLKVNFYKGCLYFFVNRSFIGFSDFFITKMNLYFIGGLLIFAGDLKIGMLFVFIKYYEKFFAGITDITSANMKLQEYKPSINRIIEIWNYNFGENERDNVEFGDGRIEFRSVCFRYNEDQNYVLDNINLDINKNECLAIVGKSGNGKTTIIKLLLGLYENYKGNIYLNNKDIRQIKSEVIHSNIAVVMQDSILFNNSIVENMKLIKPEASFDEINEACKKANIHDDIMNMPDKYDTVIGERGVQLSGGQKQRIAIARALLVQPRILILDEATAALDSDSECKIHDTIRELKNSCTIIIIAHRMNSLLLSDNIVVVDNSRIVEKGSYSELMNNSIVFNRLFQGQYDMISR